MTTTDQNNAKDVNIILISLKEIAEAVMYAAEAGTLEEVLQRIAQVAKQVVHAKYAALGVPDGSGSLKYFKTEGMSEEQIHAIGHYPVGKGLLGLIMRERKALLVPEMQKHPRSMGFPANHPKMTSLLGVPIQTGAQLFGMLYLCDRMDGLPFDEQDQWWVEALAGYAALAIAGSQLSEQHQRLTLLEERERVGMELHDGIIQSLYAIGMQLQLMRLSNKITESGVADSIRNLDQVIEDIRGYILNLKTSTYQQKTIKACLQDIMARLYIPETLSVQIEAPDRQPPFSAPVFEAVCQITQEAVSNVVRHANATTLKIQTTQKESIFTLSVSDNGTGFNPEDASLHEGLGLRNIQQRARIHGGKITVQTTPQDGTTVTLKIPLA